MREKKPRLSASASGASSARRSTRTPERLRSAAPRPAILGFGSREATTTRLTPAPASASAQEGVFFPGKAAQGSSVTYAAAPSRPGACFREREGFRVRAAEAAMRNLRDDAAIFHENAADARVRAHVARRDARGRGKRALKKAVVGGARSGASRAHGRTTVFGMDLSAFSAKKWGTSASLIEPRIKSSVLTLPSLNRRTASRK